MSLIIDKVFWSKIVSSSLLKNIASVGLIQIANYIVPILIIPYIVRALGVEAFGQASYAQNIVFYLTILINYGFEYSATQDVAINRDNRPKLREIFWTVVRFKVLLLLVSFAVLILLYFFSNKVHEDPILYFYAALINIGFVLFPTWFFQGMEKMFRMSIFNLAIKLLGAFLIVLLVKNPEDYKSYILILSAIYSFVGLLSFVYVIKVYHLPYYKKSFDKAVIFSGFPIFINNVFNTLYTTAGLTIIGLYLSDLDIGIYAGAQKIIMAVIMLSCMPISVSLFPILSRKFADSHQEGWSFFLKSLKIILVLASLLWFSLYLLSPYVVDVFLGKEFHQAIGVLQYLSVVPSLVLIGTTLTVLGMYAMKLQRYAPYIGALSGGASVLVCFVLIPRLGMFGAANAWILAQLVEITFVSVLIFVFGKSKR